MNNNLPERKATGSEIVFYQSEDGRTKLDVRLEDETVWLNQKQLTELFGKAKGTVSEHIKHIFEDEELIPEAAVRLYRIVQKGPKMRDSGAVDKVPLALWLTKRTVSRQYK